MFQQVFLMILAETCQDLRSLFLVISTKVTTVVFSSKKEIELDKLILKESYGKIDIKILALEKDKLAKTSMNESKNKRVQKYSLYIRRINAQQEWHFKNQKGEWCRDNIVALINNEPAK